MKSRLSGYTGTVCHNWPKTVSDFQPITCGVPQGSVYIVSLLKNWVATIATSDLYSTITYIYPIWCMCVDDHMMRGAIP